MKIKYLVIRGSTILALAAFWKFAVAPQLTQRLPVNWSWTANYIGFNTSPNAIDGEFPLSNKTGIYKRTMRIISEEGRPSSVRIEDSFLIEDLDTGEPAWEYILHVDVNPANGQHLTMDYQGHINEKLLLKDWQPTSFPMQFQTPSPPAESSKERFDNPRAILYIGTGSIN